MCGSIICLISPLSQAARVVAEKRECATCHIAWMADFKKEDIHTLVPYDPRPQVKTGRQDVVSTERMCFSCHDGFVLDSRFLWLKDKHTHPVGVVPSDSVSIPKDEGKTIFPLNDEGKVYCGTCHSAHGVEWGDKLSPVFLREQNIDSSLCMSCHVNRVEIINGDINHPINKEVPKQAGNLRDSGSKFSRKNEVICQSCHMVHGAQENKLLVVKNEKSQLCETCHIDKSGLPGKSGKKPYSHPVDVVPKDVVIPEVFSQAGSKFGPNSEVICQTCHKPHLTPSEKLLVLDDENLKQGICVVCHENKRSIQETGHNLLENNPELLSDNESSPSPNLGICGVCHYVHDGKGPKMWARERETEGDRVASLCLSCHSKGEAAQNHLVGTYSHPVGVSLKNKVKLGELPLFTASGIKTNSKRYGLVSCPTCHDIHGPASNNSKKSLSGDISDGAGKYLRKGETNLLELCKTCHEDKWKIANTKHDLKQNKDSSTSLGICGNCHQVHNGNGPRMWARSGGLDEKDLGALCLNCHKKGGLAEEKTLGKHSHKIGVTIEKAGIRVTPKGWRFDTKTKNYTSKKILPLYDSRGNILKGGSGMVACATCHDPHNWTPTEKTSKSKDTTKTEGDARNSFLRIPAAPDGELCTTCHMSKATVRATDHDMNVTAPEAKNVSGEGLNQSGICGQCHAVHNAVQDLALWGRPPGQAGNAPEMLCRSCHLPGDIAQEKVPTKAFHPGYVMAWDGALRDHDKKQITHLPVFSDRGRPATLGYITCPTCHNVHQWKADKPEPGTGINEEGDVFSSFLRMKSTEGILCADCHGPDAIFRYKYFHGVDFKKRNDD